LLNPFLLYNKNMVRSRSQSHVKDIKSRRLIYGAVIVLSLLAGLFLGGIYFYFTRDLPRISSLEDYRPPIITTLYSDDNRKIAEFFKERRIVVPLSEMPKMLISAFVAAEDARFFKHEGVDLFSIARAFLKNIEAGTIIQPSRLPSLSFYHLKEVMPARYERLSSPIV